MNYEMNYISVKSKASRIVLNGSRPSVGAIRQCGPWAPQLAGPPRGAGSAGVFVTPLINPYTMYYIY